MTPTLSHCFMTVDDQDKALGFYRDLLGLEVLTDVMFGPMRWLTVGSPDQPGVEIVLVTPADNPGTTPADQQALTTLMAKGMMNGVILRVDDCDALFEKLSAAGADVTQEPIDQPYGVRDCGFRDPAGNSLRFSQVLAG